MSASILSASTADCLDDALEIESFHSFSNEPSANSDVLQRLHLTIDVRRLVRFLLVIVILLFVTGTTANFVANYVAPSKEHKLARLMSHFDVTTESSIPTWYSSSALLVACVVLALIARAKYLEHNRWFAHWLVLCLLFLGLSIDEIAMGHEMVNTAMTWVVEGHGLFFNPWVIPASIFVGVVGLSYLPFLLHVERRTAVLFLLAGALYVGGALGIDGLGGDLAEHFGSQSIQVNTSECIEELFELLGQLLFIYALLDYFRRHIGTLQVSVQ
jgi:hypothetical protein